MASIKHIEVYQSADGYRWRKVAANNLIVSDSGEAYTRREDAAEAARREAADADTPVIIQD